MKRPSVRPSVCPVDQQQQQRRAACLLLSALTDSRRRRSVATAPQHARDLAENAGSVVLTT